MFDMEGMILPPPDAAFEWTTIADRPALICRALAPFARHFFTTRQWRLGAAEVATHDASTWEEVAAAAGAELVRVRQVHGRGVAVARASTPITTADIVVADDPRFAVAVQAADCVPLLIADTATGAVAAAHAGWRGLVLRVPEAAIASLERLYSSRREDLIVAAGPSIGACCYEVGPDVRSAFLAAGFAGDLLDGWFAMDPLVTRDNPSMASLVGASDGDREFFDGWRATREQLQASGVPAEQIFQARLCTASHRTTFCSYRRDGSPAGRIAGVIAPWPRP